MKTRSATLAAIAVAAATAVYFRTASALRGAAAAAARDGSAPHCRFFARLPGRAASVRDALFRSSEAVSERDALRAENERLAAEALDAAALRAENARLREALRVSARSQRLVFAEVVARGDASGWWNRLRIGSGSRAGIAAGDPVFAWNGLVGRVIEVTPDTADVMPLTDVNHRVACAVDSADGPVRGVLSGGGIASRGGAAEFVFAPRPFTADFLDKDAGIAPGARVVTSGLGGVYPAGVPVGVVRSVSGDPTGLYQSAEVVPCVDFASVRFCYVRVRGANGKEGGE